MRTLCFFDPNAIIDGATYEKADVASSGIQHVIVGGTFVVRDGRAVSGATPGRAVRATRSFGNEPPSPRLHH
jgi:N-acyl-D-aspartate/D-glutamate deacylase